MATEVEICNMALASLGASPISSLDEASQDARYCNLFYAQTRDEVIRDFAWSFAQATKTLASVAVATEYEDTWEYAYAYPSDCLKARKLIQTGLSERGEAQDYEIVGETIYTDVYQAVLFYTKRVTDTNLFDPLFVKQLVAHLAAVIAFPVTKDASLAELMERKAAMYGLKASTKDAQESGQTVIPESTWVTDRTAG